MNPNTDDKNYKGRVKAYLAGHDGEGFLIALADGRLRGVEYKRSLPQWGAWLAFFRRNKIKQPYMHHMEVWMVPTEWPHQFTSDSTIMQDHDAGDRFATLWQGLQSKKWPPKTMLDANI
jgi:hypothetical protein